MAAAAATGRLTRARARARARAQDHLISTLRLFTSYHAAKVAVSVAMASPAARAGGQELLRECFLPRGVNYVMVYLASRRGHVMEVLAAAEATATATGGRGASRWRRPIGAMVAAVAERFMTFGGPQRWALLRWTAYWTLYKAERSWYVAMGIAYRERSVLLPLAAMREFEAVALPSALAAAVVAGSINMTLTPFYAELARLSELVQVRARARARARQWQRHRHVPPRARRTAPPSSAGAPPF